MDAPMTCKHGQPVSCKDCKNYMPVAAQLRRYCLECVHAFARCFVCNYTATSEGFR